MAETSMSPTKNVQVATRPQLQFGFSEAIRQISRGRKVTRLEWKAEEVFGFLMDGRVKIHRDGKDFDWIISDGDLEAMDWVISA